MGRLTERLEAADRALCSLEEALTISTPSALERDATIKRFELAFEAMWKVARETLWVNEDIGRASCRGKE